MRATQPHVAHWLAKLGRLCAGNMPIETAIEKAEAYAPLLAREFDAAVFCADALAAVAAQCKFFPAYGELCGYLRSWWRDNKPFTPSLPAPQIPDRAEPTQAEKDIVAHLTRQAVAALQTGREATHVSDMPLAIRSAPLSTGNLLEAWRIRAAAGDKFAECRVAALEAQVRDERT